MKENNKSKQDIDNLTFETKDDDKKIYKNENQYFIKDKKDEEDKEELTPAEILYGKRKNKEKDKEKPTGGASNVYMTPIEELYERNKEDKKNMTSIDELYERKKGYCDNPNYKIDNSYFSENAIKKTRDFILDNEGFRDTAYQDKAGVWTIGYGHTGYINGKPITQGMKITEEKALELYKKDFENHILPLKNIKTPLTKNQQIALASFIYNFGVGAFNNSELRKKIEAGDIKGAANEFDKWIYVKNKKTGKKEISQGLKNRRKREKDLFLKPDSE